ncbi:MAG: flagellar basal body rod protein FlgB [Planctomycetota bacterium]
MNGLFSQINVLGNALRYSEQNHRVLSENLANVNTPGYKTHRLEFDTLLQGVEDGDASREALQVGEVSELEGLAERVDGNNVDIETEVSEIKKNALVAQAYAQLMASKLATMRRAISG